VLSGVVADMYRAWLRSRGKTGNRLVVECGRLLDPYQVLRAGLVPYWCENASRAAANSAELWLAGSQPFTTVDVLPEPPGTDGVQIAQLDQWQAMAGFATRWGRVDRRAVRAYPLRTLSPRHATAALKEHPYDLPVLTTPEIQDVLATLAAFATLLTNGLTPGFG
jgi:hypothetical protein